MLKAQDQLNSFDESLQVENWLFQNSLNHLLDFNELFNHRPTQLGRIFLTLSQGCLDALFNHISFVTIAPLTEAAALIGKPLCWAFAPPHKAMDKKPIEITLDRGCDIQFHV